MRDFYRCAGLFLERAWTMLPDLRCSLTAVGAATTYNTMHGLLAPFATGPAAMQGPLHKSVRKSYGDAVRRVRQMHGEVASDLSRIAAML
jgi:hypothetical protein